MSNHHGEFIWYELLTDNCDAALDFYRAILNWQTYHSDQPDQEYRIIQAQDESTGELHDVGGMMPLTPAMCQGGAKPIWLGYIAVEDVDRTVTSIVTAGGSVQMPATEVPTIGRIAMVTDPQGTPFLRDARAQR